MLSLFIFENRYPDIPPTAIVDLQNNTVQSNSDAVLRQRYTESHAADEEEAGGLYL